MKTITFTDTGESMWATGLRKWNEWREEYDLKVVKVRPCDAKTHDAMHHAVVGCSHFFACGRCCVCVHGVTE